MYLLNESIEILESLKNYYDSHNLAKSSISVLTCDTSLPVSLCFFSIFLSIPIMPVLIPLYNNSINSIHEQARG
jgi:hypothetical protein